MTSYPIELTALTVRRRVVETAALTVLTCLALSTLGFDGLIDHHALDSVATATVVGAALGLIGLHRVIRVLAVSIVGALLVIGHTPLIDGPVRRLVRADPVPADTADAIVVLSAGVTDDGLLSHHGADRLLAGIELLRKGAGRVLVVSRIFTIVHGDTVTSDGDQRRLLALAGITEPPIVLNPVGTTRVEAVRAAAVAAARRWRRIVLVTSPFHAKRACATFEHAGLTVTCVPGFDRSFAAGAPRGSGERIRGFGEWMYETLGWWKYRVNGWV